MNENEMKAFRMAIKVYSKWRETVIETDEQWRELAADVGLYVAATDVDHNPLAGLCFGVIISQGLDLALQHTAFTAPTIPAAGRHAGDRDLGHSARAKLCNDTFLGHCQSFLISTEIV